MKSRKFRIVMEFDGGDFSGWQYQPGLRTVQDTIEKAIEKITGEKIRVTGSGRTDAGVHAKGLVAHFSTESRLEAGDWARALNGNLPEDVRVVSAAEVGAEFDARRSARGKWYQYVILTRPVSSPLERNRVWHIPYKLDVSKMKKAAKYLKGERDFKCFQASGCAAKNTVRTIKRVRMSQPDDEHIIFDIEATAFLKQMVRNIVGTLVEIGRGKTEPDEMQKILDSRDRRRAGPTAPPQGLTLMTVFYNKGMTRTRRS